MAKKSGNTPPTNKKGTTKRATTAKGGRKAPRSTIAHYEAKETTGAPAPDPVGAPPVPPPDRPAPPEAHDLLLIPRLVPSTQDLPSGAPKMLRMALQDDGSYSESEWLDFDALGARKVYNIARPAPPGEPQRGPGFAVLPIRPDPGSQYETCYLINTENLVMPNPWTAADWDSFDDGQGGAPSRAPAADPGPVAEETPDGFELLVAGPNGKVFHVECDEDGNVSGTAVSLDVEPEIWGQLREGVVVGTAYYAKDERILPLVNVTSLKVKKGAK